MHGGGDVNGGGNPRSSGGMSVVCVLDSSQEEVIINTHTHTHTHTHCNVSELAGTTMHPNLSFGLK